MSTIPASNLLRLFWMRNIAILGQVIAVLIAVYWLNLHLPLWLMGLLISALIIINLITVIWLKRESLAVSQPFFCWQLVGDVLVLTGLLYCSGGSTNPFTALYLLPLTIAATILHSRYTWFLAALTVCCYTLLMVFYIPLPQISMHHSHAGHMDMSMSGISDFSLHVFGMWLSFVLSALLVAWFVVGMERTLRQQEALLAQAREQALRDERLLALGTLAASTAHELGTPLGTMALTVAELEMDLPPDQPEVNNALTVLQQQISRCKQALSHLSAAAGNMPMESGQKQVVDAWLSRLVQEWQSRQPDIKLHTNWHGSQPVPMLLAERTLSQALFNVLDNAAEASPQSVSLSAIWTMEYLHITIRDRGTGLDTATQSTLGRLPYSTKKHGLGLGLMLAYGIIERFGGEIRLMNQEEGGLCTVIELPLLMFWQNEE